MAATGEAAGVEVMVAAARAAVAKVVVAEETEALVGEKAEAAQEAAFRAVVGSAWQAG